MNNLTPYNEFRKIAESRKHLLKEATTTTPDTGGYGKGAGGGAYGDTYFANVKGNLAGAENTLVGSAALKLFGFIKRKGMQMYMKKVLKPKLGRVYMNGILRYCVQNGIGNFSRKLYFEVAKIVDGKLAKEHKKVSFEKDGKNGMPAFSVGADIKLEDGGTIEDGLYKLFSNDANFTVENGKISKIEGIAEPESEKDEEDKVQIADELEDDELDKYRKDLLDREDLKDVEPDKDILDMFNKIVKDIKGSEITEKDIPKLRELIHKIDKIIAQMRRLGLNEIEKLLKRKDLKNREEIEKDKLVYEANILKLLELRRFILGIIKDAEKGAVVNPKKPVIKNSNAAATTTESAIYEAELKVKAKDKNVGSDSSVPGKVKTNKVGDELLEIAKKGDAIDLNDPEFYKQFESEAARKGVTQMVLRDKAEIAKIQLAAERIIAGNVKQENAWKQMVEDVKSKYSKFMITDLVDPYHIVKSATPDERSKWETQNKRVGGEAEKIDSVKQSVEAYSNPAFSKNVEKIGKMSKLGISDNFIVKLEFYRGQTDTTDYYILENTPFNIKGMKAYRILGTIDYEKIGKHSGSDFKDIVKKAYPQIIVPKMDQSGVDANGKALRAMYVVYGSDKHLSTGVSNNIVAIMYLFSTKKDIDYTMMETYAFKLKNFDTKLEYTLPSEAPIASTKSFKINLRVDEATLARIINKENFVTYRKYDLTNENSVAKMKGITTLFK